MGDLSQRVVLSADIRPRVILVSHEGQLAGLVTIKDVLRHEAATLAREKRGDLPPPSARGQGHLRTASEGTDNGWADAWEIEQGDEHGFEVMLEEGYAWMRVQGSRVYNLVYGLVRGGRVSDSAAFDYEMAAERRG